MRNKNFLILVSLLFLVLFLPLEAKAQRPHIDFNVSSDSAEPGDSITLDITVDSNYRLQGDSVEVLWGDGSIDNVPCVMPADYNAPPQVCSSSVTHTYTVEGDFPVQLKACSDEALPQCDVEHIGIDIASGVSSYRNPLVWDDITAFIWGAIMYIYGHAIVLVVLLLFIGAYVIATSGGSTVKVQRGKRIIIWTIVGYLIMLLARGIINLIWDFIRG